MEKPEKTEIEEPKKFLLKRDGQRNLSFVGSLLSEASSWAPYGSNQNRWEELALYRTKAGKLVLGYVYNTAWEGEDEEYKVFVANSIEELIKKYQLSSECDGIPNILKEVLEKAGFELTEEID